MARNGFVLSGQSMPLNFKDFNHYLIKTKELHAESIEAATQMAIDNLYNQMK